MSTSQINQCITLVSDFYQDYKEETYKDWGDRIGREHREKHKRKNDPYETRGATAKKQKIDKNAEEDRQRTFQRKLEKEHNEYIERVKKAKEDRVNFFVKTKANVRVAVQSIFSKFQQRNSWLQRYTMALPKRKRHQINERFYTVWY